MQTLRERLGITDERLVAHGCAEQLRDAHQVSTAFGGGLDFAGPLYQACGRPQCGHDTLVETGAMKKHPQAQG